MNKPLSFLSLLVCGLLLAGGLSSCDLPYNRPKPKLTKVEDLNSNEYRLGLPLGAKAMHVGEEKLAQARPCYYNSHYAAYEALKADKIDAYLFDSHTLDYVATNAPDYTILPGSMGQVDIAIGLSPQNADLLGPINHFILQYKSDGTYDAMYTRWIKPVRPAVATTKDSKPAELGAPATQVPPMPEIAAPTAPTRTLIVGTCSQLEPLCFCSPNSTPVVEESADAAAANLTGFDMELLRRLALELNFNYEIRDLDYTTLENELAAGRIDMVIAGLNKTAAREKRQILFSSNYIESNIVALVKKERAANQED